MKLVVIQAKKNDLAQKKIKPSNTTMYPYIGEESPYEIENDYKIINDYGVIMHRNNLIQPLMNTNNSYILVMLKAYE